MEVRGPNFGTYDAKYLQVTQRQRPHSVKPNVFREMDESVGKALQLTQDLVALSPEAKEFLRMLKKYGRNSPQMRKYMQGKGVKKLIYSFKELRDLVYGEEEEEEEQDAAQGRKKKKKKGEPAMPNQFLIKVGSAPRKGPRKNFGWNQTREMIDRMIVFSENDDKRKQLIKELELLGYNIIAAVKQFGVHIIVLPPKMNLTQIKIKGMSVVAPGQKSFDGRPWEMVRGLYDNSRRLIVIGEENLGRNGRSTARHEFAHAFDHTFSEKNQRRLPLSVQLWNLFRENRQDIVSDYAGTNPQEYFAECVEAYFRQSGRDKLENEDPQMYKYLLNLFGEQ